MGAVSGAGLVFGASAALRGRREAQASLLPGPLAQTAFCCREWLRLPCMLLLDVGIRAPAAVHVHPDFSAA